MTSMARYAHGGNCGMNTMKLTSCSLFEFKAFYTGGNTGLALESASKPNIQELTGPRDGPATISLLNGHCRKLLSRSVSLPSRLVQLSDLLREAGFLLLLLLFLIQ